MTLQEFMSIIGGYKSQYLCRNLAIAHTNTAIEGINITLHEAHKYLINNPDNSQQYNIPRPDWLELRAELSKLIKECKTDKDYLDNQISEILMEFAEVASYFIPSAENNVGQSVNELFNCIVETYLKATVNQSTATYEEILSSNEATKKWSIESLQSIAKIGIALRKFANLLQGCIYANGLDKTVSHYQECCGVTLATEFCVEHIAEATYWTKTYTERVCKIKNKNTLKNPPLCSTLDICELEKAIARKLISKDGVLSVPVSELVMHFYKNDIFLPLTTKSFEPIDGILRTKNGIPVSARKLARAATDLQKNGYIDKNQRYKHKASNPDKTR